MNMLIGKIPGTIGETSVIAIIIIGAIFLILVGAIDLRIPGTYIVTFVIFVGIFGHFTEALAWDSSILSTSPLTCAEAD